MRGLAVVGLVLAVSGHAHAAGRVDGPARVLVLSECQPRQPVCIDAAAAIEASFASASGVRAELYFDYLDAARLGAPKDAQLLVRYYSERYSQRSPDVILASGDAASNLLIDHRSALWPGVPIVSFGIERPRHDLPGDVAQLAMTVVQYHAVSATVASALRMIQGARTVVYVGGDGASDRAGAETVLEQLRRQLPSVPVTRIGGLTMADVLDQVSRLPADSVVYTYGLFIDAAGHRFIPNDTVGMIAAASNRPVFCLTSGSLGSGVVGGHLVDFGAEARAAAQVALRVLGGEHPGGLRTVASPAPIPMFDWRQLRRWKIDEARLPPGSVVKFREPSFLERYWPWVAIALVQSGFIIGLLVERRLRRQASQAAASSESLNRSVMASLPGMIAIVDRGGVVLAVNRAWALHPQGGPAAPLGGAAPGEKCRAICTGPEASHPLASQALHMIDQVLEQNASEAVFEYSHQHADQVSWFKMSVQSLDRPEGGAIVSFVDITARKLAELEGRRSLQEVAHASRVTTLGELSASLAHEINQPLAAILTNAQAAGKLLKASPPALDLVQEAIEDIVSNDRRAGEIIRRMRTMLQKGEHERVPVSLNDVARDVLGLLGPEALIRRVALESSLAIDIPVISGDPVQLQQVVLNLIVNAIDATTDESARERIVLVATRADGNAIELSVHDSGTGISPLDLPRVFEPFFTTKRTGLGMGLPITRSIVEAHGGRITAENDAEGGASFRCRFPAPPGGAA